MPSLTGTVVLDPVQGRRVRSGGGDRGVADVVAFRAGPAPEGAFDPAFAVLADLVHLAEHVGETAVGDRAGVAELLELEGVLDQAQLGQRERELLVALGVSTETAQQGGDRALFAPAYAGGNVTLQYAGQLVDVPGLDPELLGRLGQRRAAAGPEFAVHPVAPELLALGAVGAGTEVEHRVVAAGAVGLQHEDRVGGLVADQPDVVGVRAVHVVGVVRADLVRAGGDHQSLTGEGLRQSVAALRGPGADVAERDVGTLDVAPAGVHELAQFFLRLVVVRRRLRSVLRAFGHRRPVLVVSA